ncbi:hypothetical protein KY284_032668 [Solanum tuberosum]|nr:hypothetical protein KY284_032668 [Solanum tuberosum]
MLALGFCPLAVLAGNERGRKGERQPAAAGLVGVLLHLLVLMGFTGVADSCSYCFSPKRKREEIEGAVDLGEERRKE